MSLRNQIIDGIIGREKGYVNDPDDLGGATKYGITEATARKYGYTGRMEDLPRELAFEIYANRYWHNLGLDEIEAHSPAIAAEVADTGVNMGPGKAAEFLQQALNAFNDRGRYYPDLDVDGDIGGKTLNAFRQYMTKRRGSGDPEAVMLAALNALQGARYIELGEIRQANEKFAFGWFLHRVATPALAAH